MELHQRVPAEKWCITKSEFFAFVEDVREVWQNGRFKDLSCMEVVFGMFLVCFFPLVVESCAFTYSYSFVCLKVGSLLLMCFMYVFGLLTDCVVIS